MLHFSWWHESLMHQRNNLPKHSKKGKRKQSRVICKNPKLNWKNHVSLYQRRVIFTTGKWLVRKGVTPLKVKTMWRMMHGIALGTFCLPMFLKIIFNNNFQKILNYFKIKFYFYFSWNLYIYMHDVKNFKIFFIFSIIIKKANKF